MKDKSKLVRKQIRDKKGKLTHVWVKVNDTTPVKQKGDSGRDNLVLYHGTIYGQFKQFKGDTVFLSQESGFAIDYADTKAIDRGIDNDVDVATVQFKGKMFNIETESDKKLLYEKLPDTVKVNHGTFWFLDADIPKEKMKLILEGYDVDKPLVPSGKKVGDEFFVKGSGDGAQLIVGEDNGFFYVTDKNRLNTTLSKKMKGELLNYGRNKGNGETYNSEYKEYFDFLANEVQKEIKQGEYSTLVFTLSDVSNYLFATSKKTQDKAYNLLQVADSKVIKKMAADAIEKYKSSGKNPWGSEMYVKAYTKKPRKVKIQDNWNFYENDTIMKIIKDLGYDGYVALERGQKTYAIWNKKSLDIKGWNL